MGGTTFEEYSDVEDVAEAYSELATAARYEHGHGGYSGTIAEKDGYVVFDVPAGKTSAEFISAIREARWNYATDTVDLPAWVPKQAFEVYDDKWGPAVAVKDDKGGWHFFGWASC